MTALIQRTRLMTRPLGREWPVLSPHAKIDVCRGLFAFLVVGAHALDICRAVHPAAFRALPASLNRLITFTIEDGIYWVMGFFVISGYCIHLSINRLMENERFPIGTYLIARVSRILPLYYAGLLFAIAVEAIVVDARPGFWPNGIKPTVLLSQLFVVQNFTQTYGSFAPSWSITNELFYYVFYGALACVTARGRKQPAWLGMGICLAAATVFQTLHLTVARNAVVSSVGHLFGLGINWFLGVLVAVHAKALARSRMAQVIARAWLPILIATMSGRYAGVLPIQAMYLISGVAFALLLVRLLENTEAGLRAEWAERAAGWMGLASYPTYLFHGPLIILIGSAVIRGGLSVPNCVATWLLLTCAGIACGIVLGFVAERPIMQWRGQMLRRLRRS